MTAELDTVVTVSPAAGVHALLQPDGSWGLSNAGLVVGSEHTLLLDTFFTERRNGVLHNLTGSLSSRPVDLLVNTHHHGDHVYGNGWFPEALIIGQTRTRDSLLHVDPTRSVRRFPTVEFGELRPVAPTLTFERELRLHLGDITVELLACGVAHAPGDTLAWLPAERVLFGGDVIMKGCTPGFVGGSSAGYLTTLATIRGLQPETIVPGHGPVCDTSVLDDILSYLRWVVEVADDGIAAGRAPLEQARRTPLEDFAAWHDPERIVGNLHRVYWERAGVPDAPFDWRAMWAETEEFHGGPLRSEA